MGNGPLTEAIQRTKKLEWEDVIHTPTAHETPFLALLPQAKKQVQVEVNWPVGDVEDTGYGGRMDGKDVDEFSHQNRDYLRTVTQWFLESWMVSHFADLTESWGVKDEAKHQAGIALTKLRLKIERALLSTMDCAREGGVNQPNELRGVFRWLENDAAELNAQYPIPENYRVSAAAEYDGAVGSFLDTHLEAMLIEASTKAKRSITWDAQVGLLLRAQMDGFTQRDPSATATNVALRQFVANANDKAYLKKVDFFEFSAGTVRSHINHNLACDKATGAPTAFTPRSGLFLDMKQWRVAFMKKIASHRLENQGGGPRGYHDVTLTLKCGMPVGQARVLSNT